MVTQGDQSSEFVPSRIRPLAALFAHVRWTFRSIRFDVTTFDRETFVSTAEIDPGAISRIPSKHGYPMWWKWPTMDTTNFDLPLWWLEPRLEVVCGQHAAMRVEI